VLWRCWLGGKKGIRPVKNWVVGCWRGFLSGARCRLAYCMAQLMPLPLTVACFSKIPIGLTFQVPAHLGSPGKGPLNGCVCAVVSNIVQKAIVVISLINCDCLLWLFWGDAQFWDFWSHDVVGIPGLQSLPDVTLWKNLGHSQYLWNSWRWKFKFCTLVGYMKLIKRHQIRQYQWPELEGRFCCLQSI